MKIVGIVCEYNPFHLGHKKQFDIIRRQLGEDCAIVCLMSGDFVQRGHPAVFEKSLRAKAAVLCGADLVLELPITAALSSAESFAAEGVRILSGFCDYLSFGTENGDEESLMATARALLHPDFPAALRIQLDTGLSFPAARQAALGARGSLLRSPNDILAVEYCKAICAQESTMKILPIRREGSYHDTEVDAENPSATAVRRLIADTHDWKSCIPEPAQAVFEGAAVYTLAAGERAILARLRTMTEAEFEALPYGSEGLWRKFLHACRSLNSLEDIIAATKSKRYTRTRLDRMVMCAYLGINSQRLNTPAPYTRVLAFDNAGREVLKTARSTGLFPHIGEAMEDPYQLLEQRAGDLYGLFRNGGTGCAGAAARQRVYVHK